MKNEIMKKLTPEEITSVQNTLALARQGKATLAQLAAAHDLANGANLNGTLGEIRFHIHRMTPQPILASEAKPILLGVCVGIFTHFLYDGIRSRRWE